MAGPIARIKLKLGTSHASSVLAGQTDTYALPLRLPPEGASTLTVRLKRKGGDPLLMLRAGSQPPSVPRRSKIVADAWDQEAFDSERAEHSVTMHLPTGCDLVHVGICNYSAHQRETCYYTLQTSVFTTPARASPAPSTTRSGLRPPSAAARAAATASSRAAANRAANAADAAATISDAMATTPRRDGVAGGVTNADAWASSRTPTSAAPRRVSFGTAATAAAPTCPTGSLASARSRVPVPARHGGRASPAVGLGAGLGAGCGAVGSGAGGLASGTRPARPPHAAEPGCALSSCEASPPRVEKPGLSRLVVPQPSGAVSDGERGFGGSGGGGRGVGGGRGGCGGGRGACGSRGVGGSGGGGGHGGFAAELRPPAEGGLAADGARSGVGGVGDWRGGAEHDGRHDGVGRGRLHPAFPRTSSAHEATIVSSAFCVGGGSVRAVGRRVSMPSEQPLATTPAHAAMTGEYAGDSPTADDASAFDDRASSGPGSLGIAGGRAGAPPSAADTVVAAGDEPVLRAMKLELSIRSREVAQLHEEARIPHTPPPLHPNCVLATRARSAPARASILRRLQPCRPLPIA